MNCLLIKKILEIIFCYDEFFLSKQSAFAVGLGEKFIKNTNTMEPCIKVFVEKKIPINKIPKNDVIPKTFLGIKTDVVEAGTIPSFSSSYNADKFASDNRFQTKLRPIEPAASISQFKNDNAGTLSAMVFDNVTSEAYILGNNHVLVNQQDPKKSIPILQPAAIYGGSKNENIIAMGTRYVPIKKTGENLVDCAAVKILPHIKYLKRIFILGEILGIADANVGEDVVKVGATTEYTEGKVTATNVSCKVFWEPLKITVRFINQIAVTKMSEKGDSGALYLNHQIKAIGLGHCGSDTTTFLNPISSVLKALNVHF